MSSLAKKCETVFTVDGFANWKKAIEKFREHQSSQSHRFATQQLVQSSKPVDQQLSTQKFTWQQQAGLCQSKLLTSLKYLARQGQALRGHDDEDGNFIQLLKLRATDVSELQQWFERKIDMTSHDIQNEILEMFAHSILRIICCQIR